MVIEWCHQIRDILQKNSALPLQEGLNPGPLVEVQFWKERYEDLCFITDQVCLHVVMTVMLLLQNKYVRSYVEMMLMIFFMLLMLQC